MAHHIPLIGPRGSRRPREDARAEGGARSCDRIRAPRRPPRRVRLEQRSLADPVHPLRGCDGPDEDAERPRADRIGRPVHDGGARPRLRYARPARSDDMGGGPPPRGRGRCERERGPRPGGGRSLLPARGLRIDHGVLQLHERAVPRRGPRHRDGPPVLVPCPRPPPPCLGSAVGPHGPRGRPGVERVNGSLARGHRRGRRRRQPRHRGPPVLAPVRVSAVHVGDLGHPGPPAAHLGGHRRGASHGLGARGLPGGRPAAGPRNPGTRRTRTSSGAGTSGSARGPSARSRGSTRTPTTRSAGRKSTPSSSRSTERPSWPFWRSRAGKSPSCSTPSRWSSSRTFATTRTSGS